MLLFERILKTRENYTCIVFNNVLFLILNVTYVQF
jgi:hypothetical protein